MRCRRAEYIQDGNTSLNKAWGNSFETSGVAKAETKDASIPETLFTDLLGMQRATMIGAPP
jgi:hypothetical protein